MKFSELRLQLVEMTDKEVDSLSDADLDKMVDEIEWNDVKDLYPEDEEELVKELEKHEEEPIQEELEEGLSASARIKKKMSFLRHKSKTTISRKIKMRRAAPTNIIIKRAKVAARRAMYKKLLRGRDKSQLSASEKSTIEARVARMKNLQSALAQKMVPKIRKLEQQRLSRLRSKKK